MPQHDPSTVNGTEAGADARYLALQGWQRCFIALEPDAATRDALAAVPVPAAARRVPHEQLHLTVTFIGALTHDLGAALIDALAPQTIPLKPAPVTRIEHWPRASHPP